MSCFCSRVNRKSSRASLLPSFGEDQELPATASGQWKAVPGNSWIVDGFFDLRMFVLLFPDTDSMLLVYCFVRKITTQASHTAKACYYLPASELAANFCMGGRRKWKPVACW